MPETEADIFDVLQSAPVGTIILDDRDNQVLFWNSSVLAILGNLDGESFARAAGHGFFHAQHEFDAARSQFAATGSLRNFETRISRSDGEVCWAAVTMEPINFENNAATLIWYFDITDAKRREHQLERSQDALLEVLDAAPTGAALTDGPERICYWNNALLDIFPAGQEDPATAIRDGIVLAHAAIAQNGQGTTFPIPLSDGTARFVAAWKFAVEFEGAPAELIWLHDVTELRRAERTAQAATAAKSAFLATMSHEIRTPMNGVMAIADLLAETRLDPDQAKMIMIVQQSAESLIRVINDILDFSKLEASQLLVESVPFRLDDVLDGVIQLLEPKATERGLALNLVRRDPPGHPSEGDPKGNAVSRGTAVRLGDPLRLRQVLLNLVGNAIKFTSKGSVTLDVDATVDKVVLRIIDTGIGISPEKLEKLFQPYQQAEVATARNYGGTGLGLSISTALLALMDGTIRVERTDTTGSCFTVTLPLPFDPTAAEIDQTQTFGTSEGLGAPRGLGTSDATFWATADKAAAAASHAIILCAEDNATNRDVLVRVLDRLGFAYDMAEDGAEALAMLDRSRHGLILTDGHMPNMNGWELVRSIRKTEAAARLPRLPVLIATADAVSELSSRTTPGEIDACLTKPLRRDLLEAAILEALPVLNALRVPLATSAPPPTTRSAALDLSVLIDLVGDSKEDLQSILSDYHTSATALHARLADALAEGDREKIVLTAHAIKGAAGYSGAQTIAGHAGAIEAGTKSGVALDALMVRFGALTTEMVRLPEDIATSLATHFG
jgi:PAS domain S-box-containing protein